MSARSAGPVSGSRSLRNDGSSSVPPYMNTLTSAAVCRERRLFSCRYQCQLAYTEAYEASRAAPADGAPEGDVVRPGAARMFACEGRGPQRQARLYDGLRSFFIPTLHAAGAPATPTPVAATANTEEGERPERRETQPPPMPKRRFPFTPEELAREEQARRENPYFLNKTYLNKDLQNALVKHDDSAGRKVARNNNRTLAEEVADGDFNYHTNRYVPFWDSFRLRLENRRRRRRGLPPLPPKNASGPPPPYIAAVIVEGEDMEEAIALEIRRRERAGEPPLPPEFWARRLRQRKMEHMLEKVDAMLAETRELTEFDPLSILKRPGSGGGGANTQTRHIAVAGAEKAGKGNGRHGPGKDSTISVAALAPKDDNKSVKTDKSTAATAPVNKNGPKEKGNTLENPRTDSKEDIDAAERKRNGVELHNDGTRETPFPKETYTKDHNRYRSLAYVHDNCFRRSWGE